MVRLALILSLWAGAAAAECRLALALALDVSSSVDAREYLLQKDGLTAALDDPDIRSAILAGGGEVALAVYEWSGRRQNTLVLDWKILSDHAAIDAAIATIQARPRSHTRFPTAMGYALGYGATLMARGPACQRRVIDLSGDGITNDGFGPDLAYRHFPFEGITVNGLAVLGADPMVQDYFEDEVRHGPGAFVETSEGYEGYRRAMTRKLYREINDMKVGSLPASRSADPG
ncbi:DUF1194 domain-containing protein [Aestuariicoccus sp. MJ-SS9]|uniref:DUF1194 domain-containing protein n=1 Tax=Aestuariicoccus sp. MJ-SS9 TaxID=3079855 RepID=UPI002905F8BA|nr:DUF1194 domain-containing protein [Aestuariicoccus sp. MJ-SS9]MDU8912411.1 DUF1194 domain-containing protein [Aestuariicoccus sp. MJ-SS9]